LKALRDGDPEYLKEWAEGYVADGGSVPSTFAACQINGLVYTRAEVRGFYATAPPDDAPGDEANAKLIDVIMFLRGNVKVDTGVCSKADLNLGDKSSRINPNAQELYCKRANDGLEEATAPDDWPQMFGVQDWVSDYEMDTTLVDDGDYDLITRVRNIHGWWDNFEPDFERDSVANRNTDEKWLKFLRTWYKQNFDPPSNGQGKVIIDNTPPVINNVKPAQNVE
jgi:hypothetical protein